jgi:HEAT repeat protein
MSSALIKREKALEVLHALRNERLTPAERGRLTREAVASTHGLEPEIIRRLESENDLALRLQLLDIIGASQNPHFLAPLERLAGNCRQMEILQSVGINLGKLQRPEAFGVLVTLLGHPHANVRYGAIRGLALLGDTRAVQHLTPLLDDKSTIVVWWPSPKADGYVISREAALAINEITGEKLDGRARF